MRSDGRKCSSKYPLTHDVTSSAAPTAGLITDPISCIAWQLSHAGPGRADSESQKHRLLGLEGFRGLSDHVPDPWECLRALCPGEARGLAEGPMERSAEMPSGSLPPPPHWQGPCLRCGRWRMGHGQGTNLCLRQPGHWVPTPDLPRPEGTWASPLQPLSLGCKEPTSTQRTNFCPQSARGNPPRPGSPGSGED